MRRWGRRSGTLRGVAALVSLTVTAAIFMLLRATSTTAPPKAAERQLAVAVFAPPVAVRRPTPEPSEAPAARSPMRPTASPVRAAAPRRAEEPATATAPTGLATLPAPAPAAETASAAPLRIDAQAIRRAIAGSDGPIRQMARRSAVELDSPRPSRSEALAETVAEKGVPDCLAPNAGGSLLSVPILLVLAAQGKCR